MATSPWYRGGTAKFTNGSTTVTGTDTEWAKFVRAGDGIQGPDGKLYQVTNVASNTNLSITPAYGSATTYWTIPVQGYVKQLADSAAQLLRDYEGGAAEALDATDRAKQSATEAKASETNAKTSETNAKASETAAEAAREVAITKATEATNSAQAAKDSQIAAKASEDAVKDSQDAAKASELLAKDWAIKEGDTVDGVDYSAKHYAQIAHDVVAQGTVVAHEPTDTIEFEGIGNPSSPLKANFVGTKADVGLDQVDNTSDLDKPVSTATQAALDLKAGASELSDLEDSITNTLVPLIDTKVDKVTGKGLSDENYSLPEKNKLAGIAAGATKNATDAQLRDRSTHTGEQAISTVTGLQSALDSKVDLTDSRLTDSREWTGATVSQAEAEAGTVTTRRAWTAQRVRQAIVAWFNGVSGGIGRTILGKNTASEVRSVLELGSAATRDVTTSNADVTQGRLLTVGDLGSNKRPVGVVDFDALPDLYPYSGAVPVLSNAGSSNKPPKSYYYYVEQHFHVSGNVTQIAIPYRVDSEGMWIRSRYYGTWSPWREIYHTGNTTVDGSGFIKQASPTINLYRDKIEQPIDGYLELEDVSFERLGVGHYVLNNCPELATEGWYLEQSKDRNSNIYHTCDWEYDENSRTLTIRTYEPEFENGRFVNGEPKDIERFIALRFSEDPSLYPDPDYPEP